MSNKPEATELTIYNGGFALVKETRSVTLRQGVQEVAVEDVAQMIEANSVSVRSLTGGAFSVLEQNYQYDLVSPMAILNKAVGSRVTFREVTANGQVIEVSGVLISAPTSLVSSDDGGSSMTYNGVVIRADDGKILLNPTGTIIVDKLPEGLISKPTLMWLIEAAQAGERKIEMSYLTQGMMWKADYVLNLDAAGKVGVLKGWVTLTNNSGASFGDAKLKLLAGEVNRPQPQMPGRARGSGAPEAMMAKQDFAQEQFGDYHLYTLGRPATVRNREMKQVSLLEAIDVPVTRKLVVDSLAPFGRMQPNPGEAGLGRQSALVQIIVVNNQASKLGMPLPMGNFKVFQRDSSGSLQLLGEDTINHTPREERVVLNMGKAFDVVADRRRTEFQWIGMGQSAARQTFEIEVRNRKETPETVHVIERNFGDFKISKNSEPFTKLDSDRIEFVVNLKANEVRKITYTVESRW